MLTPIIYESVDSGPKTYALLTRGSYKEKQYTEFVRKQRVSGICEGVRFSRNV